MRRVVALLALLIPLLASPAALAEVTRPGTSEVRQDGTKVSFVIGVETDKLVALAGESEEVLAAFMTMSVRVQADEQSCPSQLTRADPMHHNGVAFTRLWLEMECPIAEGEFQIVYELPMANVVDYELGGDTGTFRLDSDHAVMKTTRPGFASFFRDGLEHVVSGWDHVLFLVLLLLAARGLREVLVLGGVFLAAQSLTFALALLDVVEISNTLVDPLIAGSIVYLAVLQVLDIEPGYKPAIVLGFGLVHGLGFADAITIPDVTPMAGALTGAGAGIVFAQVLVIAVVFPLLVAIRRFEWARTARAATGSAAAAIGLFLLSQAVLGG